MMLQLIGDVGLTGEFKCIYYRNFFTYIFRNFSIEGQLSRMTYRKLLYALLEAGCNPWEESEGKVTTTPQQESVANGMY